MTPGRSTFLTFRFHGAVSQGSMKSIVDPFLSYDPPECLLNSFILAETEPWVQPLSNVLDPFLNLLSFAMVRFACAESFVLLVKTDFSDTLKALSGGAFVVS